MTLLFRMLAIIGPAMFAGVMLAIGVILGGYWKSLAPADFLDWFADNGSRVQSAVPLVVIPTLIGFAGMLWIDWSNAPNRFLWLGAIVCIAVVLIMTMAWFVPANTAFATKAVAVDAVAGRLDRWLLVHNIRIALAIAAAALGVWAISR